MILFMTKRKKKLEARDIIERNIGHISESQSSIRRQLQDQYADPKMIQRTNDDENRLLVNQIDDHTCKVVAESENRLKELERMELEYGRENTDSLSEHFRLNSLLP